MVKIDAVSWGKVKVDGQEYWQVLIIGEQVIRREVEKIKQVYGTDHVVADWEQELLLSGKPEIILIVSGWSGLLKVDSGFKAKSKKLGIGLKILLTPKAVDEYNRLAAAGSKVNVLIHTTC